MNYASLEDHAPAADALATAMLGVTVKWRIGARVLSIKIHGDFSDGTINAGTSIGIKQEMEGMVLKSLLPVKPARGHRIILPARPGDLFEPSNVSDDDTGRHWIFNLNKVAA